MGSAHAPTLATVLEFLPVLPADVYPSTLQTDMKLLDTGQNGFLNSKTREWNFLYQYHGCWYRLPHSVAVVMMNNTTRWN